MSERVAAPTKDMAPRGDGGNPRRRGATPWRGGFAGPQSSVWLAAQRLGKSWRLLLAVELGMVIAVALLATIPLYADLMAGAQLQRSLLASATPDRNIQVDVTVAALSAANLPAIDQAVNADVRAHIASIITGSAEYLQTTRPLSLTKVNGQPVAITLPTYPAIHGAQDLPMAFDYSQAAPHMKLLAGRLPRDTAASAEPEVMVTPAMGARPGETLRLVDSQFPSYGFDARVVGVWFPKDERDPFWNGLGFDTVVAPNISNPPPPQFPVLFTRQALVQTFTFPPTLARLPMGMGLHYIYFVAPDQITVSQAKTITERLTALRTALGADVPGSNGAFQVDVATRLGDTLSGVANLLAGQALPLYSVDAQLVALALLFIFAMAGLLIESQAAEIATLKSRGASTTQVLLTYLAQGALLATVALVVGVAVAGGLALALLRFFVPLGRAVSASLTPTYAAQSIAPRDALAPAVVGAALGMVALALATWQAARHDALTFRREQGRASRTPFWQRYYLDLGLVALCLAGYVELATFGGQITRAQLNSLSSQSGGSQVDLIQLLAPTLMLLAGALLLQRVAPWLMRAGAWLAARGRGATGMLAFAQVSRSSTSFNRLTLLLTLAVGLGLFSLTYQSTLARSASDDAYYQAGADERVVIEPESQGTQSTTGYAAQFAKMPGVVSVSPMYRGIALTMPNQGGQNVDVLGIDPGSFAQTATWRSDYASQSLASLMASIARAPHGASVGETSQPLVALIDQTFAQSMRLQVGQRFQLSPQEEGQASTGTAAYFIVGAIVNDFPSLYDEYPTGYIIVDVNDYLSVLANPTLASYPINGPNEFLLRTGADPQDAKARALALTNPDFFVQTTYDARTLAATYRTDTLAAGMSGLLLLGALIAALLALVGVVTQASVTARRRQRQFAILRTLGLDERSLLNTLLVEQALVYLLGVVGGVAIGALLAETSLPFMGFSDATYAPPVIGIPSADLAVNLSGSTIYLGALLAIFVVALLVAAGVARASGLGKALRVGED